MVTDKTCSKCGNTYPTTGEYFYFVNKKYPEKGFQSECRTCSSKRSAERNRKNRESYLLYLKEYREKNSEKMTEIRKKWRRENADYIQEYTKEWRYNHPEESKKHNRNRQKKNHKITTQEWTDCKDYFNNTCAYCGLTYENHKKLFKQDLHKEHVEHNGANDLSNCIPSCKSCNSEKWEYNLDEWYNDKNPRFTKERLGKIMKWLETDYQMCIKEK